LRRRRTDGVCKPLIHIKRAKAHSPVTQQRKPIMSSNHNPVVKSLRHMGKQLEEVDVELNKVMTQQAHGGDADPDQFKRLLELKSVTKTAMIAQFNLNQKPLKTVLNESK
jgi:hypothetical protein